MKITGNNGLNVSRIYNENKLKAAGSKQNVSKSCDTVEISKEGMEIAKFVAIARDIPDVRDDKVESIKGRIKDGTYSVSSDNLASSLRSYAKEAYLNAEKLSSDLTKGRDE